MMGHLILFFVALSHTTLMHATCNVRARNVLSTEDVELFFDCGTSGGSTAFPNGWKATRNLNQFYTTYNRAAGSTNVHFAIALVKDASDTTGVYADASDNPTGDCVSYRYLGARTTAQARSVMVSVADWMAATPGTFRMVAIMANSQANCRALTNGGADGGVHSAYHFNSDGYKMAGTTAALTVHVSRNAGLCGIPLKATNLDCSDTTPGYTDTPTITVTLASVVDGTTALHNPKNVKLALRKNSDNSLPKTRSLVSPNATTGVATTSGFNIDNQFAQAATAYDVAVGCNDTLGDTTTQAGEKSDLIVDAEARAITIENMTTSQRSWVFIDSTVPGGGDYVADSASSGGSYAIKRTGRCSAGYDVTVDASNPTSPVATTNPVVNRGERFTRTLTFKNVHGDVIVPTGSMKLRVLDSGGAQEHETTDASGDRILDYNTIGNGDLATNDLTGRQKHLQVVFAHYGSNDPTITYSTGTGLLYKLSRKHQASKSSGSIDNGIKTGKTAGADDVTVRNRGQTLHFDGYLFDVRGNLLASPTVNFNVRPIGSETYEETNDTVALASGRFQDNYVVDTDETVGDKSLVIASSTTASANQPRTGTGGNGNFAETNITTTNDSVGTNHGTLVGTTLPVLVASPWGGGNAFEFDGVPDLGASSAGIQMVPTVSVATANGSFKVKAKVKRYRQGAGVTEAICGKWGTGLSTENFLLQISGDKLAISVVTGAGATVSSVGTTTLVANTLYEVEGEWTGTQLKVKVNGVYEGTTPAVTTLQAPDAVTFFTVGRISGSTAFPFDGIIDTVEFIRGGATVSLWDFESVATPAEWAVSATYTVESRVQKESTRNADAEDIIYGIAVNLLYNYGYVADATGDIVVGAATTHYLIDPEGIDASEKTGTTGGDGWTVAKSFVPQPPESTLWVVRVEAALNGNTGSNDQVVTFASPNTSNKDIIVDLGPIVGVPNMDADVPTPILGDIGIPGDRVLIGFAVVARDPLTGVSARVNLTEGTPRYALAVFDQDTAGGGLLAGGRILQSDNVTFLKNTDPGYAFYFRDFKENIDEDMAWVSTHGTAAQGVTSGNGYPTAEGTSTWPKQRIYVIIEFDYSGLPYVRGREKEFGHRPANDMRYIIVAGVGNPLRPGTHWQPGDPVYAECGIGLAGTSFVGQPFTTAGLSFLSENEFGQTLYLDASLNWVVGTTAYVHAMSASPADANKALFQLTDVQTASWPVRGVLVVFKMKDVNGRTHVIQMPLDVKGPYTHHDIDHATQAELDAEIAARVADVDAEETSRIAADAAHVAAADPHTQYQKESEKGVTGGYAPLDSGNKVPVTHLPNSIMEYQGTWNASTNTPTLADGAGNADEDIGDVYKVTVAGTQDLGSAPITFQVGDYIILNASKVWEKSEAGEIVAGVGLERVGNTINMIPHSHVGAHAADGPIGDRS